MNLASWRRSTRYWTSSLQSKSSKRCRFASWSWLKTSRNTLSSVGRDCSMQLMACVQRSFPFCGSPAFTRSSVQHRSAACPQHGCSVAMSSISSNISFSANFSTLLHARASRSESTLMFECDLRVVGGLRMPVNRCQKFQANELQLCLKLFVLRDAIIEELGRLGQLEVLEVLADLVSGCDSFLLPFFNRWIHTPLSGWSLLDRPLRRHAARLMKSKFDPPTVRCRS
mmetsp:Transcript_57171/g.134162  ORF Transcript_57171/g.134162 Transcript_57171/m.134162 type:complete len:227 (-) Transcript_57171:36-716(-)